MAKPTMKLSTVATVNTRLPEQPHRENGFLGTHLDDHEDDQREKRADEQADDGRRSPGVLGAAPRGGQDQAAGAQRDEQHAEVVDHRLAGAASAGDRPGRHHDDHDGDRHVDVERPPPGQVVGEQSAEQRPEHRGHAEHRAERALVLAAFPQRDDLADQRRRGDHQTAGADALHGPAATSIDMFVGQAADERPHDEDQHAELENPLAAEQVSEFPGQHGGHGLGQQVGGDHPAHVPGAAEVADDGRQRGRDDRLVQRGQQHAEQDRREDDVDLRARQLR